MQLNTAEAIKLFTCISFSEDLEVSVKHLLCPTREKSKLVAKKTLPHTTVTSCPKGKILAKQKNKFVCWIKMHTIKES